MKDIQATAGRLHEAGLGARTRSQVISERDTLRRAGLLIYVDQRSDMSSMYTPEYRGHIRHTV